MGKNDKEAAANFSSIHYSENLLKSGGSKGILEYNPDSDQRSRHEHELTHDVLKIGQKALTVMKPPASRGRTRIPLRKERNVLGSEEETL